MPFVLPETSPKRSFGSQIGQSIAGGLQRGVDSGKGFVQKLLSDKFQMQQKQNLINQIESRGSESGDFNSPNKPSFKDQLIDGSTNGNKSKEDQFISLLPQVEQKIGRELQQQEVGELWNEFSQLDSGKKHSVQSSPYEIEMNKAKSYAAIGEHDLSKISSDKAKQIRKENFSRESTSEPELIKLEDKLNNLELEDMRFSRMEELSSPEHEDKFPSSLLVGLFTKDGELNPVVSSQLSEDAQEFVKLVYDNLTGLKDSFGSRVTNLDVQSYLKKLPGLINTPEGRRRVLRDLRIVNQINSDETKGVLEMVDRYGGPGEISISKAKRMFNKEYEPKKKELAQEFINPNRKVYKDLPSASLHKGKTLKNPSTGEVVISDGTNWNPR